MNDIWAAFTALTRLPLWKIKEVPKQHYEHITDHWSMVGWLTGGVMSGVLWLGYEVLSFSCLVAIILACISRLLLTGALHEDGLMDVCDGFGGGHTRQRILEIMKDSHTGAYATIGFVMYILLLISLIYHQFNSEYIIGIVFIADPMAKFIASHIPMLLPYARKEEESKMKVEYRRRPPLYKWLLSALFGLAPMFIFLPAFEDRGLYFIKLGLFMLLGGLLAMFLLYALFRKRIGGYTGDCLGATFVICEIGCYIGASAMNLIN